VSGVAQRAAQARLAVLGLGAALFLASGFAILREAAGDAGTALLAAALLLPLALPLPGIVRRERRTYAWATFCVMPHFIYGLTEVVANPSLRLVSAAIVLLATALTVALVAYLRFTRPRVA
jgi:uncharacterized membrane protein